LADVLAAQRNKKLHAETDGAAADHGRKQMETPEQKSEPKIFCSYKQIVELEKLTPNPRNPNRHSEGQIALLAKIIQAQGWRNPITVSKRSGFIVAGHARYLAAQRLGLKDAPVDFQDFESEASEWAHMIADNRIAELAETDNATLKDLLLELDTGAFDMDLTGFSEAVMEDMMTALPPVPVSDVQGVVESNGRFILIYTSDEEKALLQSLLKIDGKSVCYTVQNIPALNQSPEEKPDK